MNRLFYIILSLLFSGLLLAETKKPIYLADVSSKNVPSDKRSELKSIIQKTIENKYKTNFLISNIEDVNHHLKVEKAKQLKGTCDEDCEVRIISVVTANSNANEFIFLKMKKNNEDFQVIAKRVDSNMKVKSTVILIFPQNELGFFAEQIALKLMNKNHKILSLEKLTFDKDEVSPFIDDSKRSKHKQKNFEERKNTGKKTKNL